MVSSIIGDKKGQECVVRILIVIPAYNEAGNIERVVDNLITNYPQYEYVVVNDGSKDSTAKICKQRHYNLINLPINLGLAGAFQTGIKYAYEKGYDAAIQLDGDGQHDPIYIWPMIDKMLQTHADIVIGSRFINRKKPHGLRMLGSRIISFAIWMTTRKTITDPTSGFRLFSRSVLNEFANHLNYGPEPDTISYLLGNGAVIREIQVEMKERVAGKSYLTATKAMQYMLRMVSSIILIQYVRKRET